MQNDIFDSPTMQIPLTKGHVTIIDTIDADLAELKWNASVKNRDYLYVTAQRRARIGTQWKIQYLHRVILARMLDRPLAKGELVDHINRNPLDNRRCNLRLATPGENIRNSRIRSDNSSGYRGVSWSKTMNKWWSVIHVNKQQVNLGYFADILDAVRAYNQASLAHFGEFGRLNELPEES
jgi:hypothetical protein